MNEIAYNTERTAMVVFLVASMLASGLRLTPRAVMTPLKNTRLVLVAVMFNFIVAPAFAWLLTRIIPLDAGHAAGLLLLGTAAGAPFLPAVVETARGDVPTAVTLRVLLTLGTIVFMPFALPVLIPGLQATAWSIASPLLILIVVPLVAGMLMRGAHPRWAAWAAPWLTRIGNATLVVFFVLLVVLNLDALMAAIGSGAVLAAAAFITGLLFVGSLPTGMERPAAEALALATIARNFGAALVPATRSFREPNASIMIIIGAVVCMIVSFLAAFRMRSRNLPTDARS